MTIYEAFEKMWIHNDAQYNPDKPLSRELIDDMHRIYDSEIIDEIASFEDRISLGGEGDVEKPDRFAYFVHEKKKRKLFLCLGVGGRKHLVNYNSFEQARMKMALEESA